MLIKLTYFEDLCLLGCEKSDILIDFRLFCCLSATPTNRAGRAHVCRFFLRLLLLYFLDVFLMVLLLGEQNCKSHGAFKANVNIEDATSREQPFDKISRCAQTL